MIQEPGNLSDFRTLAWEEWDALSVRYFGDNGSEQLLVHPGDRTLEVIPVKWAPIRYKRLSPGFAQVLSPPRLVHTAGDIGRAELQEEYFDWHATRTGKFGWSRWSPSYLSTGKCWPHSVQSMPAGPNASMTIAALADRFADPIIQLKGAEG